MSSYYGGKPGGAFIIVKSFTSIKDMATAFAKGPGYTDVNFDEYVLINTVNKNNPENGQIFRRGLDYKTKNTIKNYKETITTNGKVYDETSVVSGGAIYIGTIVGPSGRAPLFNLGQYEDLEKLGEVAEKTVTQLNDEGKKYELTISENYLDTEIIAILNTVYPNGLNIYGDNLSREYNCVKVMVGDGYRYYYCDNFLWSGKNNFSAGWYRVETAPSAGSDSYSVGNASLVPGVTYDGYETDETGRKHLKPSHYQDTIDWRYVSVVNENLSESTAFVGFRFGVPVIEFEAEAVDAYYNRNDEEASLDYDNINLITSVSTDTTDEQGNPIKHPYYSKWDIKIPKGVKGDCISNIRVVPASAELMMLDLDEDGNLVYNKNRTELSVSPYSNEDDIINSRMIIVADYTNYDRVPEGDTGLIYLGDYNMINTIDVADNGTVTIDYTHNDTVIYQQLIKWIKDVKLDEEGHLTVTFNQYIEGENNTLTDVLQTYETDLSWLQDLTVLEDGSLVYDYTINETSTVPKVITYITGLTLTDDGVLTINMNNDKVFTDGQYQREINWIDNFTFDKDTGALTIEMNSDRVFTQVENGESTNVQNLTHTLNYIKNVELRTTDNHILVTHSDPEKGVQDIGSIQPIMAGPADIDTTNLATYGLFFVETES